MIINYLQDGVLNELKMHDKCQLKMPHEEPICAIFPKIVRDKKELQIEISSE